MLVKPFREKRKIVFVAVISSDNLEHFTPICTFWEWWKAALASTLLNAFLKHIRPPNLVLPLQHFHQPLCFPSHLPYPDLRFSDEWQSVQHVWVQKAALALICQFIQEWVNYMYGYEKVWTWLYLSLVYVTHYVDGAQACSRLALSLRITERLVVVGAYGGKQGRVDQGSHQNRIDNAKETPNLKWRERRSREEGKM